MTLKEDILKYSRQASIGELTPWFDQQLTRLVGYSHLYATDKNLTAIGEVLVAGLKKYSQRHGIRQVCLGMSGGVDSALTAALFKAADWDVYGLVMPIHQNPEETARGIEACKTLDIDYKHVDLTDTYERLLSSFAWHDPTITAEDQRLRRGNLRVRLRMMTVYNEAGARGGLVGSTDNFSELAAGFWTLHGDVGDLAPIQSLNKSWEVPKLAEIYGVPASTVFARPTDGLGISDGDEAQFGFSYLEFDIVLMMLTNFLGWSDSIWTREKLLEYFSVPEEEQARVNRILDRIERSAFKRQNPYNLQHPADTTRYTGLARLDQALFRK